MSPLLDIVIPSRGPSEQRSQLESDLDREMGMVSTSPTVHLCEGPSAATNRNAGASRGTSDWIVFLDDDIRLPVGWLKHVESVLARPPGLDIFSGTIMSTQPDNVFSQVAEDFVVRHKLYGTRWFLVGAMLFVRRSVFEAVGGFDERFLGAGGEDWDFCQRAHAAGVSVGVIPDVRCAHANPTTFAALMRRAKSYGATDIQHVNEPATTTEPSPRLLKAPPLAVRIASWPTREYKELRNRGRTRRRAFTSTALYIPWMARYLWWQRSNVSP